MLELLRKSAAELAAMLQSKEITSVELTKACLDRIAATNDQLNAFLTVDAEGALATAQEVDAARAAGRDLHPLAGVPIAIKDNIVTRGLRTTCASKILGDWRPPYDATVIRKIKDAKLPIVGKTNMDEFAMGSSTEHSAFGATANQWDLERIPGGSGGGSAVAVGAYMVPLALGSDTGGSIRQPGAFTGTVGVKPTYGAVSRYGLVAMASSLDQIGPVTRTVEDAALLQDLISGNDPFDSTSLPEAVDGLAAAVEAVQGETSTDLAFGIVRELSGEGYQDGVREAFDRTVEKIRAAGGKIVKVSCPSFDYALSAYYLIMPAEASSNLARFDGMRYGLRVEPEGNPTAAETMAATREAGFGDEVKRRIILGTHVLSAGYYDAYYGSAQKVRTLVQRDFQAAFAQADVLISPTAPTVAFKRGERISDPMSMYLNDVATIPANLAGVPGMSIPNGVDADNLPIGFQILAPATKDALMYRAAKLVETLVAEDVREPEMAWEAAN